MIKSNIVFDTENTAAHLAIESNEIVFFYHDRCFDGFVSALIVHCCSFKEAGKDIQYIASDYNTSKYALVDSEGIVSFGAKRINVKGKAVIIADFSFSPQVLDAIGAHASQVIFIDHHESAVKSHMSWWDNTQDIKRPWLRYMFSLDNKESGAMLCWLYFNELIDLELKDNLHDLVQDCMRWDLWLDEGSPEALSTFSAYFFKDLDIKEDNFIFYLENFKTTMQLGSSGQLNVAVIDSIRYNGQKSVQKALDKINLYINRTRATLCLDLLQGTQTCKQIVFCNMPKDVHSLAGSMLCKDYPHISMTYVARPDGIYEYSVRSKQECEVNALLVAQHFGGGGHIHAAGFTSPLEPKEFFGHQLS